MKLVNCTPHAVVLCDQQGTPRVTIEPSGSVARCTTTRELVGTVDFNGFAVPITSVKLGKLTGLPELAPDTLYVVSAIAGQAAKAVGRTDVVLTDDAVRDAQNKIVGCRALARL